MSSHKDSPYIEHMLDAINDIEESLRNLSKKDFKADKDKKDATVRRIEIIGEAVKNISKKTRGKYPEVEWKKIAGTRDKIIHHYFGINWDTVWDILGGDLQDLKVDKVGKKNVVPTIPNPKPEINFLLFIRIL